MQRIPSHWVVALERTFDFPADESWWPPLLERVAQLTALTHARVGSTSAIQVSDPRAPEEQVSEHCLGPLITKRGNTHARTYTHAQGLLEAYEKIWSALWVSQLSRTGRVRIEAEFGPSPYAPALPYTKQPISDLADVVDWISQRQVERLIGGQCHLPQ